MVDLKNGSIVWVRRRNGSWWPGKILGPDELSASLLKYPRSGTPVKLLGREDASVDWYNLEKSKRVKAFRCGEFDDFIKRAEASLGVPPKKREKYARREDAILHALELERDPLGKRYGGLGCSSTNRSKKLTDDLTRRELQTTSKYLKIGNGRCLRSMSHQLSHKSGFFLEEKSGCSFSSEEKPKYQNQFSEDDDNSNVPARMRGLKDLGLNAAPSEHSIPPSIASDGAKQTVLGRSADAVPDRSYNTEHLVNIERKSLLDKRKLSEEGFPEEIPVKKRDRHSLLAQGLESCGNLPVSLHTPDSGSVCISDMVEEQAGDAKNSKCNLADKPRESLTAEESNLTQMEFSTLKREDKCSRAAEFCEQNASGSTECTETDSSETDSDTDDELATLSDGAASIELERKYIGGNGQPEHGSMSSEELDELADDASHTSHQESVSAGFGVSKWQLKGKRNNRSLTKRPVDFFDGNLARRPSYMTNFKGKEGYSCLENDPVTNSWVQMARYGSRAPRGASRNMFNRGDWAWDDQPASRGYWEEPIEYFDPGNSYHHSGGRTMLVNVDLKVQSSYQREHVPLISITSKINGQAIVGYPIQIEALANGSSESIIGALDYNFPETSDNDTTPKSMWRTACRTANVRVPWAPATSALDNPKGIKHVQGYDRYKNVRTASIGGSVQKGIMTGKTISQPAIERTFPKKSGKSFILSSCQKIRTLSSIASQQKHSDQVNGAIKPDTLPTVVACIPVKLVFSRLNEALVIRHP